MCDFISKNKELFNQLDFFINSAQNDKDALMNTLLYAQNIFGYLPKDVQIYIGDKLNVSYSEIDYLVNFYHYFTTELKGKYKINVCLGSACSKNGSSKILSELENLIGIKSGQTTPDMKFSLESSRCVGACRKPPIITINGKVYDNISIEDIPLILENCK
ncbi:NADH-quinone oxidoreductase subunit NuoE family protein [Terrisporobacter sp.]